MCFYARFLFSSSRLKLLVVQRVHWEKEQKHLWWKTHCFVLSEWQELIFRFLLHDSSEFVSLMCLLSVSFLQAESTSLSQRSAARWAKTLSLHGGRLWTKILQEKRPENARQITLGCQGPPVSNLPAEILTRFQLEPTPPYSQKGNYCTTFFMPAAPTYLWVHLQEKPYACHLCGVRYNQIATLNQHLKKHDVPKSASRNFHCHFCGLRFSHKADLNLHQKQEHEAQPQPYVCRRCKRGFARLSGISGHHCILLEEKTDIPIEIQTAAVKPTEEITVEEPEVVTSIIIQETVLKAEESHEIVQLQEQQPVSTVAKLLHKSCILRFFLIFLDKW